MHWSDEGFVLSARRHGEAAVVLSVFTRDHGRHAGLVRGGAGRRLAPLVQTGNRVAVTWRARLAEQLGSFTLELVDAGAARLLDDRRRLAALAAATAVADVVLPERHPYPRAFAALARLSAALAADQAWDAAFVRWEVELLADLGFGLDLGACAVTGQTEDLGYVSPRTGRAVTRAAAEPYRDRLLPLPGFLVGDAPVAAGDIADGLRLTARFLEGHALAAVGRKMPGARSRLLGFFTSADTRSGGITGPKRT